MTGGLAWAQVQSAVPRKPGAEGGANIDAVVDVLDMLVSAVSQIGDKLRSLRQDGSAEIVEQQTSLQRHSGSRHSDGLGGQGGGPEGAGGAFDPGVAQFSPGLVQEFQRPQ